MTDSDYNFEKFYNSALKFLSYRPRSEKEVKDKLKILTRRHSGPLRQSASEASLSRIDSGVADAPQNDKTEFIIEKIILKLKEQKFINDEEFAKLWVESRLRSRPRSTRLIKIELKQKGIAQELIDQMINDEGLMINDLEQAKRLVEKKMRSFALLRMTRKEIYEKLGRFLASKGFDWDTIKESIDEALDKGV